MPKNEMFNREEVVSSAISLFQQKGYNGTSIGDIVKATNLSRSSIYNSFDSKLNMFLEAMAAYNKSYGISFSKAINDAPNAKMAFYNIFDVHVNAMVNDDSCSGCLVVNSKAELWNEDGVMGDALKRNQDGLFSFFLRLIKEGKEDGSIPSALNSEETALYLVTAVHGLRLTGMSHNNSKQLNKVVQLILKCLD